MSICIVQFRKMVTSVMCLCFWCLAKNYCISSAA